MSRCVVQKVICPRCGGVQDEKVFVSVNGARITHAADEIIDGTWNAMSCLKCGVRYTLDSPLLYSDLPGRVWIAQYAGASRDRFAELEEEANGIFQREFIDRPPAPIRSQALAVTKRICFGRRQLAEKLLARREGMNDRALECLKLVLLRDFLPELYPLGPAEFYLREVDSETLGLVAVPVAASSPAFPISVKRATFDEIEKDLESFQHSFPALFEKLYVNASRFTTDGADALLEGAGR